MRPKSKYRTKNNELTIIAVKSQNSGSPSPVMDPIIWNRLPPELLDHILSLLPLKTFFNLKSTCKHFNYLLYSPKFISNHSSSSNFSSFLLLSHPQYFHQFPLYDSLLDTWRILPLSHSFSLSSSSSLLSSSNGLVCFSLRNSSSFLVSNLLSNSSRVIEFPFYPFSFEFLTLVSTPLGLGYKIFMVFSGSSSLSALVFDSKDQSWLKFDNFEPMILGHNNRQEGVCYNGDLYFVTPEPFSIVRFDLETGNWEQMGILVSDELAFVRLVSDGNGKLFMIGGIGSDGISRSLKLWEFSEDGNWVEVESVPEMICRKFLSVCYHNYEHVYCFWHQGMICICCYTWPEILYYKVSTRTWHWLPKCPSLPERWSCGFRWFSFVPELYASV